MTVATDDHDLETSPEPIPSAGPGTPRRPLALLPWLVALGAIAVAVFSTVQWQSLRAEADDRRDVVVAATNFVTDLVNWDASDGIDDTVQALREQGTGRFLAQAEQLFGGPVGDELELADASSTGEIEDLFVQSLEGDRAEVFAVVAQRVSSDVADASEVQLRRVILQLERVEDTWRVENVELPRLIVQPGAATEE